MIDTETLNDPAATLESSILLELESRRAELDGDTGAAQSLRNMAWALVRQALRTLSPRRADRVEREEAKVRTRSTPDQTPTRIRE